MKKHDDKVYVTALIDHFLQSSFLSNQEESELKHLSKKWVEQNGGYSSLIEKLRVFRNNLPTEKI